jgi:hypothetical protein
MGLSGVLQTGGQGWTYAGPSSARGSGPPGRRQRLGREAPAEHIPQQPADGLRPQLARGTMQGFDVDLPIAVLIGGHFIIPHKDVGSE